MLLNVDATNGVDSTLRTVQDGEGTSSVLQLSTTTLNVNGIFQVGGFTVTVPAAVTFGAAFATTAAVSITGAFTTAAAFTTSGAFAVTQTYTGITNVTFPTTGTLATLAGSETLTNKIIPQINDTNGNEALILTTTASAVNEITVANAANANAPTISATGGDTNIDLGFQAKGSGTFNFRATASAPTTTRLYETTGNGTNYVALAAPTSITNNSTVTLPEVNGTDTIVCKATTDTLTNKTLTNANFISPVIQGSTSATGGNITLNEGTDNGISYTQIRASAAMSAARTIQLPDTDISCFVVQRVSTQTGAVATGTTVIPFDDTIPQNTEGDQYMTLAITPKNTANILKIEVTVEVANTVVQEMTAALFQDSTAGALAAICQLQGLLGQNSNIKFTHTMSAGTTSATTFKVRVGGNGAGTTTFNGNASVRIFGGVMASSIVITEFSS
jgi:hypothetical protein